MNNFIQYELWKDCRNGCTFCFNKQQQDYNKIQSLNNVIQKIEEEEVDNFNEIGFIGGEFFDNQLDNIEVKQLFYKLFENVIKKMKDGKIVKVYFTTSLLYKDSKILYEFLDFVKSSGFMDKFLLCTSYDIIGRFHTEESRQLWCNRMKEIHSLYPTLMLHTETIVTGAFVDKVLNNEFNIKEFKEEFNTDMDYLQPNAGYYYKNKEEFEKVLPGFFPTRKKFLDFLVKTTSDGSIDLNRIFNRDLQSDTVYIMVNGKELKVHNRRKALAPLPCDMIMKSGYIDSNIPMKKDVERMKGV